MPWLNIFNDDESYVRRSSYYTVLSSRDVEEMSLVQISLVLLVTQHIVVEW